MSAAVQIVIFVASTLAFLAIASFLARSFEGRQRSSRMLGRVPSGSIVKPHAGVKSLASGFLEPLGKLFSSSRNQYKLRQDMQSAGYYGSRPMAIFGGAKIAVAAGLPLLFLVCRSVLEVPTTTTVLIMGVLVVLGLRLPGFWLARRVKQRRERLRAELPDCLDLMVVCVESGLGLDAALLKISEKMSAACADLAQELRLVHLEVQAGQPRQDALRHLSERTGVKEIQSLVAKLIQSDKFGTSIAKSLRVHADTIREKRKQHAEEQAGKTAVKLLFPLVFFIFPALFVAVLGPAIIQIIKALGKGMGG